MSEMLTIAGSSKTPWGTNSSEIQDHKGSIDGIVLGLLSEKKSEATEIKSTNTLESAPKSVQKEAKKVNWFMFFGLLTLGILPGLIYLYRNWPSEESPQTEPIAAVGATNVPEVVSAPSLSKEEMIEAIDAQLIKLIKQCESQPQEIKDQLLKALKGNGDLDIAKVLFIDMPGILTPSDKAHESARMFKIDLLIKQRNELTK